MMQIVCGMMFHYCINQTMHETTLRLSIHLTKNLLNVLNQHSAIHLLPLFKQVTIEDTKRHCEYEIMFSTLLKRSSYTFNYSLQSL